MKYVKDLICNIGDPFPYRWVVDTNTTSQVDQTDQKLETDMVPWWVGFLPFWF